MTDNLQLTQLVEACRWIGAKAGPRHRRQIRRYVRMKTCAGFSESGKDKGSLTPG